MLTKNFYALMRIALGKIKSEMIIDANTMQTVEFPSTGSSWYGVFPSMCKYKNTSTHQYVEFGNGTTPATVNDYKLESEITTGISVSSQDVTTTEQTDSYILWTATFGVKASVETTISEIGLFSHVYTTSGNLTALVDRTVLDTPITIPAGQSKQITYTIRFNYSA